MHLVFDAIEEDTPGPAFRAAFDRLWPAYRDWFLRVRPDGRGSRGGPGPAYGAGPRRASSTRVRPTPSVEVCRRRLRQYMPELEPTYDRLCTLAGDDETACRFLSCYQPPRYLAGCSQVVADDGRTRRLLRNYDLSPALNDGLILLSAFDRRRVIACSEFLWGVSDGMNDQGLAVSLAFGGRAVVGRGFGLPLVLRYVLEVADRVGDALEILENVPIHMAYNVTLLDRDGEAACIELAPDRAPCRRDDAIATNHQAVIDDEDYARFTRTRERERRLRRRFDGRRRPHDEAIEVFLEAPLYATGYGQGFGTLYTASYEPATGTAEWHWPGSRWTQSFATFREGWRRIGLDDDGARVLDAGEGLRDLFTNDNTSGFHTGHLPANAQRTE